MMMEGRLLAKWLVHGGALVMDALSALFYGMYILANRCAQYMHRWDESDSQSSQDALSVMGEPLQILRVPIEVDQQRELELETRRNQYCNKLETGKFYAVARGERPGVYVSWLVAGPLVNKFAGNLHQRFNSRHEAEHFMRANGKFFEAVRDRPQGYDAEIEREKCRQCAGECL